MNFYLVSSGKENGRFIKDRVAGFEPYKTSLLSENYEQLIYDSGLPKSDVESLADQINLEHETVLIASEKELSPAEMTEIKNLCLITGKLGKTASGMISLREKNNSQGLMDLQMAGDESILEALNTAEKRNLFIFGEDPLGCAIEKETINNWLENAPFILVQDYFLSETAEKADLILPAALPGEFAGSFTNTQKTIQIFDQTLSSPVNPCGPDQLLQLIQTLGSGKEQASRDVHADFLHQVSTQERNEGYTFTPTTNEHHTSYCSYGCDLITKHFIESFNEKLQQAHQIRSDQIIATHS